MIRDLNSTNGSFVNGKRIKKEKQLNNGDKVRLGTSVFEIELFTDEDAAEAVIPARGQEISLESVNSDDVPSLAVSRSNAKPASEVPWHDNVELDSKEPKEVVQEISEDAPEPPPEPPPEPAMEAASDDVQEISLCAIAMRHCPLCSFEQHFPLVFGA